MKQGIWKQYECPKCYNVRIKHYTKRGYRINCNICCNSYHPTRMNVVGWVG